MIPKKFPYARYDFDYEGVGVYCITDDWDFGDYDAAWHFHVLNLYPKWKFEA